jgi:phosphoribosylglycinamide formyltransferase-1
MSDKKRIAIFASGGGSNAAKIMDHFMNIDAVEISIILCNKEGAGVFQEAAQRKVEARYFGREEFYHSTAVVDLLKKMNIDLIVLAGFLWKVPENLIDSFRNKIVNIHPALLPKYGGKGMYGAHVHKAVHEAGESESGITVHYVNEHYDEGAIIFQAIAPLDETDTPKSIEAKVRALEIEHFAPVIEGLLNQ